MPAFQPIGIIRSPFGLADQTPVQPYRSTAVGQVELLPDFAPGLRDIEGFSHIILLYFFHQAEPGYELEVVPLLDVALRGLFSTRYPRRPNPIGLSVVRLLRREERVLYVSGIDVLDGTPLLDIKPYVRPFDAFPEATLGWLEGRT
jgi:tRNA (adenine37-N6)-methyltransferase